MRSASVFPLDELHDQRANAVGLFEAVNDRNVGMIQRRKGFGFAFESRQPLRIVRKRIGENLDGDVTAKVEVRRAIDLAQAAHPDPGANFIRAESDARGNCHYAPHSFYAVTPA
jgi:hypothetical protein